MREIIFRGRRVDTGHTTPELPPANPLDFEAIKESAKKIDHLFRAEDEEATCKNSLQVPNPISFDEPITKEAVGRVVVSGFGIKYTISNISIDGEWLQIIDYGWNHRVELNESGWHFESPPEEITIEEAEKLTGKKIKR